MCSYKVVKRYFTYILVWSFLTANNMSSATKTSQSDTLLLSFSNGFMPQNRPVIKRKKKRKNYMYAGHFFPNTVVIMVQETETIYLQIQRLFVEFSTLKRALPNCD